MGVHTEHIILQIAHFKAVNNIKAVNKYINVNVNGIPYKCTIFHYMFRLFKNYMKWPDDGDGDRGGTVAKVLYYKSEGRWFDPSWCHWNFSMT